MPKPHYKTIEQLFWNKIERQSNGCWQWIGPKFERYGSVWNREKQRSYPAHRFSWEMVNGPVPKGLELDHTCRNRFCVNPDHLEPVTHAENVRRGAATKNPTHCPKGHDYADHGRLLKNSICKVCRECERIKNEKNYNDKNKRKEKLKRQKEFYKLNRERILERQSVSRKSKSHTN